MNISRATRDALNQMRVRQLQATTALAAIYLRLAEDDPPAAILAAADALAAEALALHALAKGLADRLAQNLPKDQLN